MQKSSSYYFSIPLKQEDGLLSRVQHSRERKNQLNNSSYSHKIDEDKIDNLPDQALCNLLTAMTKFITISGSLIDSKISSSDLREPISLLSSYKIQKSHLEQFIQAMVLDEWHSFVNHNV